MGGIVDVNELKDILKEFEDAVAAFKTQVEKLYGGIETTDFADEYKKMSDVHDRLQAYFKSIPEASAEG